MIGAGTKDLAEGLARVATLWNDAARGQAVWMLDAGGNVLAGGGATALDGDVAFERGETDLVIRSLPTTRLARTRELELAGATSMTLVLTGDAADGAAELDAFSQSIGELLERESRRDHESEDTTEHLLACFEQIRAVHDLADRLPGCENVEEMARMCLESLLLAMEVRVGALVLRQDGRDTGRAMFVGEQGTRFWSQNDVPIEVDVAPGPVAQAFLDGKVRYGATDSFESFEGVVESLARRRLLVVPICFGSESAPTVLGCLVLIDRDSDRDLPFGSPEAELTQSVSVLLGLALGTQRRASAEKELQIARSIQETLIPERSPSWGGIDLAGRNEAANQVGGDYFDFLKSVDGHSHVVIADVSGHNMASAMAMVMARSQLKAVLTQKSKPGEILEALASGLFADLTRNELFITVFMLTIVETTAEGTVVRFTNAGHNPPLLWRSDGTCEWLEGGGPMVGFMPSVDYEEKELVMRPGDVIVLYTDGVTEVTNENGDMLDEDGLAEVVASLANGTAQEILDGIFRAVGDHAVSAAEDDVTAVVIRCTADETGRAS